MATFQEYLKLRETLSPGQRNPSMKGPAWINGMPARGGNSNSHESPYSDYPCFCKPGQDENDGDGHCLNCGGYLPQKESVEIKEGGGAGAGVPYVGQKPDPGGEMSWQGAAGGGRLHSAKAVPIKKAKKK